MSGREQLNSLSKNTKKPEKVGKKPFRKVTPKLKFGLI